MMIDDLLNELAQLYDDSDKETNFRSRLTITADETHAYRTECLRVRVLHKQYVMLQLHD